jgi:hypothetical protein
MPIPFIKEATSYPTIETTHSGSTISAMRVRIHREIEGQD